MSQCKYDSETKECPRTDCRVRDGVVFACGVHSTPRLKYKELSPLQPQTEQPTQPADAISVTLNERATRYGQFSGQAHITQNLKRSMVDSANWATMSDDKREALDMIAGKIARVLNGDPNYHDSWHDISGYAKLVADTLI